jgi:hypothetical protein
MATTANLDITIRNGRLDKMPILSGETVYNGAWVALSSGYIVDGTSAVTGSDAVGLCKLEGDAQTADANGSLAGGVVSDSNNVADVYMSGQVTATFNSLSQAALGQIAFLKDNATLTVSSSEANAGNAVVGFVTKYISSTKGEIDLFGYST